MNDSFEPVLHLQYYFPRLRNIRLDIIPPGVSLMEWDFGAVKHQLHIDPQLVAQMVVLLIQHYHHYHHCSTLAMQHMTT